MSTFRVGDRVYVVSNPDEYRRRDDPTYTIVRKLGARRWMIRSDLLGIEVEADEGKIERRH